MTPLEQLGAQGLIIGAVVTVIVALIREGGKLLVNLLQVQQMKAAHEKSLVALEKAGTDLKTAETERKASEERLQTQIADQREALNTKLQETVIQLTGEWSSKLGVLEGQLGSEKAHSERLEEKFATVSRESGDRAARIIETEKERDQALAADKESRESLEKANTWTRQVEHDLKEYKASAENSEKALKEVRTELETVRGDLKTLQDKFEAYRTQKHDERDRLMGEIASYKSIAINAINWLKGDDRTAFLAQMKADGFNVLDELGLVSSSMLPMIATTAQQGIA